VNLHQHESIGRLMALILCEAPPLTRKWGHGGLSTVIRWPFRPILNTRPAGRARKPLWVTGPSRVQISPSPPHFLRVDPPARLSSEDRPQGRFSSFSGDCIASAQKRAREGPKLWKTPQNRISFRKPLCLAPSRAPAQGGALARRDYRARPRGSGRRRGQRQSQTLRWPAPSQALDSRVAAGPEGDGP
jgi:hypothetical protein